MKYLLVALGLTTMVACKNNDKKIEEDKSVITEKISEYNPELKAEDPEGYNVMVNDTVDDGEMYLGAINYIGLKRDFGSAWFTENYNAHLLDSTSLPELKHYSQRHRLKYLWEPGVRTVSEKFLPF